MGSIDSLPSLLETFHRTRQLGHDWRVVIDALRPHTQGIWQRFNQFDQTEVARLVDGVERSPTSHGAPTRRADLREITTGQLRIAAGRQLTTTVRDGRLQFDAVLPDGTVECLRPAAVIDCTGPELNWSRSRRSLLRGLL